MTPKSLPLLFSVLACAMFASCAREDAADMQSGEDWSQSTSEASLQKPPAIPSASNNQNWTILSKADLLGKDSNPLEFEGIWQPTDSDVLRALQLARPHLRKLKETALSPFERERSAEILASWNVYSCQAIGHTENGKKLIHMNFFDKEQLLGQGLDDWRHSYVMVSDGGASFWQIEYDREASIFLKFRPHGDL
jgi:hypothetical protein